ncbi:YbfB/YjiJ family MFS transporter, partial [Klebsiella pneumoniae]|nr:YbfB/YjiJ family MFS transporter [Klebsiella pneumoniae]
GFATGATGGINKKSILSCHRLLLTASQPERGWYATWTIIALRAVAGALSAITLIAGSLWLLEHMGHHHASRDHFPACYRRTSR